MMRPISLLLAVASVLAVDAWARADEPVLHTDRIVDEHGAKPADAPSPILPRGKAVVSLESGAGVVGYLQGTANLGPAWNVRATVNLTNRFGVEANYLGSYNRRVLASTSLVMTAVDADCRYNILRGHEGPVQPFLTAGLGWAGFTGLGGDMTAFTLPVGLGAERSVSEHFHFGARFSYRLTLLDDLGVGDFEGEPGGDTYSLLAHLGGSF